ncbi:MAG: GTPase Era [Balneolaceae bacterium]
MTSEPSHKSGYVAIIGRPNAGKSTLMNTLLGNKISIATHKPQTTRHQVIGIHSDDRSQIIFLDTPGVLIPKYELQSAMMRFVERAKNDADLILLIVDSTERTLPKQLIQLLESIRVPLFLIVNKMDLTDQNRAEILAKEIGTQIKIHTTFYLSALTGEGTEPLLPAIRDQLNDGPPYYPKDILSEQPMRFFASELIREQIFLQFHEEIPYSCTVEIAQYEEREELDFVSADIIVNRKSQKGMLIGKGGKAIKKLGIEARKAIEDFSGRKIYLDLHVKVREKWREKENWVRNLGYQ